MLARLGPPLTIAVLAGPVLAGLAGTLLPAFGYLPALGGTGLSLAPFRQLLAEPGLVTSVALSLFTGLSATVISLLAVALFTAAAVGKPAFARIRRLVSPLLAVPHAAVAFGLAFLIAPSGMVARLISPELTGWTVPPDVRIVGDPLGLSLVAGLAIKEIPFLFLVTLAALPQTRWRETRQVAAALGYGRVAGFAFTTWPAIYAQIRLAVFAVLAFSTSVVDVAAVLAPTTPPPLALRLVGWMGDPDLSMRFKASAGALLQLGLTGVAFLVWIILERAAGALRAALAEAGLRMAHDRALAIAARATMLLAAGAAVAGLAVLALWSFAGLWQFPDALPRSLNAGTWLRVLPRLAGPLATTLVAGVSSTIIAVLLVVLCLMREDETGRRAGRAAMTLVYLPLLVPQAAFLFGLQALFLIGGLAASLPALIAVHLVFVLPYVFLSLSDPWRARDPRYDAVAFGFGRSRREVLLRVRLPMLLRAILVAAAVGFAVSAGQYLPTLLVGAGRLPTLTTEAVALASGGNRRVIGVYAFMQMLLPAIGFAVAIAVPALIFRRFSAMRA